MMGDRFYDPGHKNSAMLTKEVSLSCEMPHRNLIDYMCNGYAYCQMIIDEGHPVDFMFEEVNEGYEKITGLSNVAGRRITDVLPGIAESDPDFLEKQRRVTETGMPDHFDINLKALNKWLSCSLYSPEKGYTVTIIEDITDRKEAERQLQQRWSDLNTEKVRVEENDRAKTEMLAYISHEIRSPMTGILGFSELLKTHLLSTEEQAEYIDLIYQSGQRMLHLIDDLNNISCIEAGKNLLHITETSVNSVLHGLHAFFKLQAEKKGLWLHCTTELSDSESMVKTDSLKLTQIVTNLIQNALKFTNSGGIDFGYALINGFLEFYVIDSGIGIPLDMQQAIFDQYRQGVSSLTRKNEGSGLGLRISKTFVEMMGGTIRVKSLEDWGSIFFFNLPYNPPCSQEKICTAH